MLRPKPTPPWARSRYGGRKQRDPDRAGRGFGFAGEKSSGRYRAVSLTELQRLSGHSLLVVAKAATEADRCRNDNGKS